MGEGWGDFFAAQVGGSAALLGLLFVGVSLNLSDILKSQGLANRALLALVLLLIVMILSLIFLIPGLGQRALGVIMLAIGGLTVVGGTAIEISLARGEKESRATYPWNFLLFELSCVPYVVAGALLFLGNFDALYWAAAGMIISIIKATTDAWVLLVEINR